MPTPDQLMVLLIFGILALPILAVGGLILWILWSIAKPPRLPAAPAAGQPLAGTRNAHAVDGPGLGLGTFGSLRVTDGRVEFWDEAGTLAWSYWCEDVTVTNGCEWIVGGSSLVLTTPDQRSRKWSSAGSASTG
jgi:hypothetical protein